MIILNEIYQNLKRYSAYYQHQAQCNWRTRYAFDVAKRLFSDNDALKSNVSTEVYYQMAILFEMLECAVTALDSHGNRTKILEYNVHF